MLNSPVEQIKGIGSRLSDQLALLNIETVEDLLFYFPYRYEMTEVQPLNELTHDDTVTIVGRVVTNPSLSYYGRKKSRLTFQINVEKVIVKVVMFNREFLKNQLKIGDVYTLTGKWDAHRLQITASYFKKGQPEAKNTIEPVYSVKGDVKSYQIKRLIKKVLNGYAEQIEEFIPEHYRVAYKIPNRKEALISMHFPQDKLQLKHARRRFVYEEFLLFQLKLQLLRQRIKEATVGDPQNVNMERIKSFINQLPFTLTEAQQFVLKQILKDMESPFRMNRLLQGDVGSGKTAVAAICLYASITAGKQGALMVPTEILAEQHYVTLTEFFSNHVAVALLTGSTKAKERKQILFDLKEKNIDIIIGTHALIQDDVYFNDLGLVIIDEQHRFGVEQRRKLRDKGLYPDVLFMTATPIPRTLAITSYGDMDLSVIDEMPKGRKKVETYWVKEHTFNRVLTFIQKRIQANEQAYIICPLIEESDKLDIQNAVDLYDQLNEFYPSQIKIGLMHGKLSSDEKDDIMRKFSEGELHILVSTTVVEVGVNVPNATVMVIYDAERFGLAQLHQLRGRVGRGNKQSYCILIADPKGDVGKERMKIMTMTNNGFELAEYDLKLRGPGDYFGRKQSGLPEFKIADVVHDERALETARKDAYEIIEKNLLQEDINFQPLKVYLENSPSIKDKLD